MKYLPTLVTGAAGFIGFHLSKKLLERGTPVIGLDDINDYYDVNLKRARIDELYKISKKTKTFFELIESKLENYDVLKNIFDGKNLNGNNIPIPQLIVNLAAQAGVRYSIENPNIYVQSNIVGFHNILEISKNSNIQHLVYASSSSVYGGNTKFPFSESDSVNHPVSLYAATKKTNELLAHTYSHLYDIPATALRFFTVYGPWGRPDMALFLFTKAILDNKTINIFNNGDMARDFTYIDDIIESVIKVLDKPATKYKEFNKSKPDPSTSWAPHRIFNIGNSKPTKLMDYIKIIEDILGIKANKNFMPMQPGDVKITYADTSKLENWINFKPSTNIEVGVTNFIKWYLDFYQIKK